MSRRYQYHGYVIERGDYVDTSDDRIDRWYMADPDSTVVDRRGSGFGTLAEVKQAIDELPTYWHVAWIEEKIPYDSVPMGTYISRAQAEAELSACKKELLAECLPDSEDPTGENGLMTEAACRKGTWKIWNERPRLR